MVTPLICSTMRNLELCAAAALVQASSHRELPVIVTQIMHSASRYDWAWDGAWTSDLEDSVLNLLVALDERFEAVASGSGGPEDIGS